MVSRVGESRMVRTSSYANSQTIGQLTSRRIHRVMTQSLMCLASFADLLWVLGVNRRLGISDHLWVLFGDEVLYDFVYARQSHARWSDPGARSVRGAPLTPRHRVCARAAGTSSTRCPF